MTEQRKDIGREATVVRWAQRMAARHGVLLAYVIPSLLSLIAVQTWFQAGTTIATGDLAPPVAPGAEYASHWSHLTAGEGAPTFDLVGLPYAAWLDTWGSVGVEEELAQRLWLTLLFVGATAAVVFLAFGFTSNPLAAGAAGLLATFNAYRLVVGPDPIPMAAILVAALLGGLIVRAALRPERRPRVVWFAVASLGLGYVMSNPPHVVLVVLLVAACAGIAILIRPNAAARIVGYLAQATPLALLVNAWWIVPAVLSITAESFDERFTAASVDDWSWTHERATLTNALTLNTHWAWDYPEYYPFAAGLSDSPFDLFVLALPVLAVAGVVLGWTSGHKRLVLGLGVTAVIGAWLATGLRGPVPELNRWLYDNVPGYWLFREPSKLLLLVALPVAILAGIALSRLLAPGSTSRQRALGLGLAAAALLSVHPLFTGEAVPDDRPLLPSAHVRVPAAWEHASAVLNKEPAAGKVLVLPRSDYYQLPTTWGYYGTSFAQSMIQRPVLEVKPGQYFDPPRVLDSLVESIETDLVAGRSAGLGPRLEALGVRYVLLRGDIDPDFPDRRIARPALLRRGLARTPGIRRVRSFGPLAIYRVGKTAGQEVFAATPVLYGGTEDAVAPAIATLPGRPGFVADPDDQRAITDAGVRLVRLIRIEHEVARRVAVKRQGGRLRVRLTDPFRLTAGGRVLRGQRTEAIAVPAQRNTPVVITTGDVVLPVQRATRRWQNLELVGLRAGEPVSVWRLSSRRSIDPASSGQVADCNAVDDRRPRQVGLQAKVTRQEGRRTLRLSARAHSACVNYQLARGRSRDLYTVRFDYRQVRGLPPRACVWQTGVSRCAEMPALQPGPEWKTLTATVRPHPRATGIRLFLYADGPGRAPGTVAAFRAIRLGRYDQAGSILTSPRVQALPVSQKTQMLAFARPPVPPQLDLEEAGPVGDCQSLDQRAAGQLGLDAQVVRESGSHLLRLSAREHSACVDFAITPIEQGARAYRIGFEYRRISGNAPRVCLWQVGPNRCARLPQLQSGKSWHAVDETVELDTGVQALRLFLYADGGGDRQTVVEYRRVRVGPVGSVAVVGIPRERPLPRIVARREAPWKFRVRVENARGPFLLATGEAFASGWKASAEGHDDAALRHVEVNGYANGWLVPWKGSYEMTLEYGPERYARGARMLTIVALLAVLGWVGLRRLRAFDVQRRSAR